MFLHLSPGEPAILLPADRDRPRTVYRPVGYRRNHCHTEGSGSISCSHQEGNLWLCPQSNSVRSSFGMLSSVNGNTRLHSFRNILTFIMIVYSTKQNLALHITIVRILLEKTRATMRVKGICLGQQLSLHIHNKKMVDLESEGQGDGARHPQWWQPMANIKIYKRHYNFFASSRHF